MCPLPPVLWPGQPCPCELGAPHMWPWPARHQDQPRDWPQLVCGEHEFGRVINILQSVKFQIWSLTMGGPAFADLTLLRGLYLGYLKHFSSFDIHLLLNIRCPDHFKMINQHWSVSYRCLPPISTLHQRHCWLCFICWRSNKLVTIHISFRTHHALCFSNNVVAAQDFKRTYNHC